MSPSTQRVRQPKVKRSPRRHRDTEKFGSCDLVSGRPRTPDYGSSYPLLPLFLRVEDLLSSHNEKSCSRFCAAPESAVEFPGRPKWVFGRRHAYVQSQNAAEDAAHRLRSGNSRCHFSASRPILHPQPVLILPSELQCSRIYL